jgi:hypothetical protein
VRPVRRRAARLFAAGLVGLVALTVLSPPASAHIVIRLDFLSPQPDARVGRDTEVVIYAQAMLAGVRQTTFELSLDGHSIDPVSGQPRPEPVPTMIHVQSVVRVPLHGLTAGAHRLSVTYRPDQHMLLMTASVSFRVGTSASHSSLFVALVLAGVALLSVGLFILRRRSITARPDVEEGAQVTAGQSGSGA